MCARKTTNLQTTTFYEKVTEWQPVGPTMLSRFPNCFFNLKTAQRHDTSLLLFPGGMPEVCYINHSQAAERLKRTLQLMESFIMDDVSFIKVCRNFAYLMFASVIVLWNEFKPLVNPNRINLQQRPVRTVLRCGGDGYVILTTMLRGCDSGVSCHRRKLGGTWGGPMSIVTRTVIFRCTVSQIPLKPVSIQLVRGDKMKCIPYWGCQNH